jgi:hypothetical protein
LALLHFGGPAGVMGHVGLVDGFHRYRFLLQKHGNPATASWPSTQRELESFMSVFLVSNL